MQTENPRVSSFALEATASMKHITCDCDPEPSVQTASQTRDSIMMWKMKCGAGELGLT